MPTVLTDADVVELLTPSRAISWMREALVEKHQGRLLAPPRVHTDLGDRRLVFTTGARGTDWFGYRSYDSPGAGEQVVVVHDAGDGRVRGVVIGNELGPRRVGAIGAVAVDALARRDASSLALVGTGTQAWAQLEAISAVRDLDSVLVYSRSPDNRAAFAQRAGTELDVPAQPAARCEDAVRAADIVVLATNSPTPVIEPGWIATGASITTVGPKQVGRAEFGPELVSMADVAVTDSIAQLHAYDPPNVVHGTPQARLLTSLGAVLAGTSPGRASESDRTLFCSVGLAGTEVFLLSRLLDLLA